MEKLSFKNYSPRLLIIVICLIIAVKFGLHELVNVLWKHKAESFYLQALYLLLSFGTVLSILGLINKYCVWKWVLKLLGLCYVKGNWHGYIKSSFHEDDDPSKPNIILFCKVKIVQNLNGFHVVGSYFTDEQMTTEPSSRFTSRYEEMEKQPDGSFRLHYFFTNTGDQFHSNHKNYTLNNHQGVCILTCDQDDQMHGNYFNNERLSHGKIVLQRV
jgi:hypothetical protein